MWHLLYHLRMLIFFFSVLHFVSSKDWFVSVCFRFYLTGSRHPLDAVTHWMIGDFEYVGGACWLRALLQGDRGGLRATYNGALYEDTRLKGAQMQPSVTYQFMNPGQRLCVFLKEGMPFSSHKTVICFSSLPLAKLHLPRENVFQSTQQFPTSQQRPWKGWLKFSPGQYLDSFCVELVKFCKKELFRL